MSAVVDYPADTVEVRSLADGRPVVFRPIGPGDAALLQAFVRRLSPASRRQRFQTGLSELQPAMLERLTRVDHRESAAFAVVVYEDGEETMIGEARYAPDGSPGGATEFALAVADDFQQTGLGTLLMDKLLRHARLSGVRRIHGDILYGNTAMERLARKFGFTACRHPDGGWLRREVLEIGCAEAVAA